jgi:uncharacterized repeat protein (TIGR03803 family)
MTLYQKCLAVVFFTFIVLPVAFATGAGKSNVPCQGTIISPTDDIVSIINNGTPGQTFCIEGEHRITSTIHVKPGQSLIGTTTNSRISGAVVLSPWQPTSTQGVYYYDGPYANTQPHQQEQYHNGGPNVCYWVSTYLDDLFFRTDANNDQRIMRVLSQTEVDPTHPVTTPGQAVTAGEAGRFFFDYLNHRIYVSLPNNRDPNTATVDLAISLNDANGDSLIRGVGQSNIALQNLFIEKGMDYGIAAGTGWTLKDMTIRFIHNIGAFNVIGTVAQPATIDDTLFTNNGQQGLQSGWLTTSLTVTNSEMSWNNIANFQMTNGQTGNGVCTNSGDAGAFDIYADIGTSSQPSVIIDHLWSHDNIADGLRSDRGTQYTQITNSTLNGNERFGYFHEISCQVLFSGNTVYDNGYPLKNHNIAGGGVEVTDSNYGTFSSNLIYGNDAGFGLYLTFMGDHPFMDSNPCLGAKNGNDTSHSLEYNQVLSNTIYSCSGPSAIGKVWGGGGPLNSRGNVYQSNQYHLPDGTSNWFVDADAADKLVPQDWSTWQQGNHDTEGTLTAGCTRGHAGNEQVAYNFPGNGSPERPYAGLTTDKAGNLYGTTQLGGAYNQGTVFELTLGSSGWTETILYSFTGNQDGSQPTSNVIFDSAGHLYGTTTWGGGGNCPTGCGTIFELTPSSSGWTESVLYSFSGGSDGRQPNSGVVLGASGALYGTSSLGGTVSASCPSGCGTAFALTPGRGGWSQSVLYAFTGGNDGSAPYASLTLDRSGNIYGTTTAGGASGNGTVFMLTPSAGQWTESILHSFSGTDGALPYGGLVLDTANNIYGTTYHGGATNYGVVFELSPAHGGGWKETVLHDFEDRPAANPAAGLVFNAAGNLYGTTMQGGNSSSCAGDCGTVFSLARVSGNTWKYNVLHVFGKGADGYRPSAPLLVTGAGTLFGVTQAGGAYNEGVVFEVTP